tara:strand:- start:502 stop:633 length:132 start_codon:yes stop_codon:yes gene_type:complete
MTKIVEIELHMEDNDISDAEVYNYLTELMENGMLHWTIKEGGE